MLVVGLRRRSLALAAALGAAAIVAVNVFSYSADSELPELVPGALAGRTVAVDPGHGGVDGGARYHGLEEKDVALAIAVRLGCLLRDCGATVVFTREGDIDYYTRGKGGKRNDLVRRVEIINSSGAAVFVSIHANAIRGARWSGAEAWYNPRNGESRLLAETVQRGLRDFPPGNKRQAKQDSDILVLKDTIVPGVLIETGFLSNQREAAMLADPAYQQKMAEAIARALVYHFSHNVGR